MLKFFLKMSENDALREYLRANGRKGAAATKRRYADDPSYYQSLGKRGGVASGASRRAKTAARAESASELENRAASFKIARFKQVHQSLQRLLRLSPIVRTLSVSPKRSATR